MVEKENIIVKFCGFEVMCTSCGHTHFISIEQKRTILFYERNGSIVAAWKIKKLK